MSDESRRLNNLRMIVVYCLSKQTSDSPQQDKRLTDPTSIIRKERHFWVLLNYLLIKIQFQSIQFLLFIE